MTLSHPHCLECLTCERKSARVAQAPKDLLMAGESGGEGAHVTEAIGCCPVMDMVVMVVMDFLAERSIPDQWVTSSGHIGPSPDLYLGDASHALVSVHDEGRLASPFAECPCIR